MMDAQYTPVPSSQLIRLTVHRPADYECLTCGEERPWAPIGDGPVRLWRRDPCSCDVERERLRQAEQERFAVAEANRVTMEAMDSTDIPDLYRNVTVESIIQDRHNQQAVARVTQWAESPFDQRGLFLYGPPGTGKTMLAAWALIEMIQRGHLAVRRDYPVRWSTMAARFVRTPAWLDAQRPGQPSGSASEPREVHQAAVVVLDDLGVENPTEWARERIYTLIDDRYVRRLPTLVTSNLQLGEIAVRLGKRTASRLAEMCAQVELSGPDRRIDQPQPWWTR